MTVLRKKLECPGLTHFLQVCPGGQPPSEVQGQTIGFWLSGYLQYPLEYTANLHLLILVIMILLFLKLLHI